MSQTDSAHAWWSRLRHQGLLLSPVVMIERYPDAPEPVPFYVKDRLRNAHTRFLSSAGDVPKKDGYDQAAILQFTDSLIENFIGHPPSHLAKQHSIPDKWTVAVRIGTRSETLKPHRILFADETGETPALMVMADNSPHVGRGRGRTTYARFLELLRGTGHRLGLLTNGHQFRLIYAGLDFESWCEWESDRWFDDGEGTEELLGLKQLLAADSVKPAKEGVSGLLDAIEESRKRQADLSSVLRENVRQAVELLLEEVSTANRVHPDLFNDLVQHNNRTLSDAEAHEALMQATVRVVMRLVVCLFAESRQLLPVNDPIYAHSYGVRTLYQLLDEAVRHEGGTHVLFNRQTAWPRLMALFRLIHDGSSHGGFPIRPYGGILFRPGEEKNDDAVSRALHILEYTVSVDDATIFHVLKKLLRGPLPVIKGKSKTYVEGPVDYTDLRTEFIGLIYEGLLDYRLKRTDEEIGPQIFLNIGREPVLPLSRLTDMLENDKKGLKDLLSTLGKEKAVATAADETEDEDDEAQEEASEDESPEEEAVEVEGADEVQRAEDYLDAVEAAKSWAKEAVMLAKLVPKQRKRQTDSEYQAVIEAEANKLIKRVVATGEFYLVRAGNTRKGTGTFYTRPQLAVPTVHRTLQPLCYDKAEDGTLTPKSPDHILELKVCDPACGSASFLVAALHYLTDALFKSLCHHRNLDDPARSSKITLPFGAPRTNTEADQLVPFPPDDPQRGDAFEDRVKAMLRRHVVERCIYGVDINALAVELARVSLWVETLDPELPFSFLDHKIKVGNSLVGCWLDRVEDYPLKAWEREGGDGKKGERSQRIEEFLKGEKVGNRRSGDGRIKKEMRQVIESRFSNQSPLFSDEQTTTVDVVAEARAEYEKLHELPITHPDQREGYYREHILNSSAIRTLKSAMDEWCAIWFWPTDEDSLQHVPTPFVFHTSDSDTDAIVAQLASEVKFFHWEIEFPDVFSADRSGFDCVLGNPPWETVQQESNEFFTEYDPLYRTYGKQAALRKQKRLFESDVSIQDAWADYCSAFAALNHWVKAVAEPQKVTLARGAENTRLQRQWEQARTSRHSLATTPHPFISQGTGKNYTYKLFLECCYRLLHRGGRCGVIVPSGLYSDNGTKSLRDLFLDDSHWEWFFCFENKYRIFDIHSSFKFGPAIIQRGRSKRSDATPPLNVAFMVHRLSDWELSEPRSIALDPDFVSVMSPKTRSLPEVRTENDFQSCKTIYDHSQRVGDELGTWTISYTQEFNMTSDSKLFPQRDSWEEQGYKPNCFGDWLTDEGECALPFYQGGMIHQFDFSQKVWSAGLAHAATWSPTGFGDKQYGPRLLMAETVFKNSPKSIRGAKLAFRDIARNTDERSMICCVLYDLPCGNSLPLLTTADHSLTKALSLSSVLNSFSFDFAVRQRGAGTHLNWFLIEESPLPKSLFVEEDDSPLLKVLACHAARLTFLHRRFAPVWLLLRNRFPEVFEDQWKRCWAVTELDRLRLRVEIEALVANSFGLDPNEFDWIVRDDQSDPKGFYRVDRELPFSQRLTGLSATAFRALKQGCWSIDSVHRLSHKDFFEALGIPEISDVDAAIAKGESGPLILKRDGCQTWKPEDFSKDDPRHGWTWDDCWTDAVAVLGSEVAVRNLLSEESDGRSLESDDGVEDSKQGKLF